MLLTLFPCPMGGILPPVQELKAAVVLFGMLCFGTCKSSTSF